MADVDDVIDPSPAQKGMLYQALSAPAPGLYTEQVCLELEGTLDLVHLRQAWQEVIEREEALRSSFHLQNIDRPLQVVHGRAPLPWRVVSLTELSPAQRAQCRERVLSAEREQPFELSRAPLFRLTCLRASETSHFLVWTFHHLVLDGWSMALVLQQVFERYTRGSDGPIGERRRAPSLREVVFWRARQDRELAKGFWRSALAGVEPIARRARRDTDGDRGYETIERRLSSAATGDLSALARRARVPLSTVLQAAWALQLARVGGRRDIVFGITVSGRPADLEGADRMVGMLINTVPLRMIVDPRLSALEWLRYVDERSAALRPYDYVPVVELQDWAGVPAGRDLFDTLLVVENYPVGALRTPSAALIRDITFAGGHTHHALVLLAVPGDRLMFRAIRRNSASDIDAAASLTGVESIVKEVTASPERPLSGWLRLTPVDTPAGSVARGADGAVPAADEEPRTETERTLAGIWAEVLGVERVGRRDDFFDLGGHSLVAVQLLSRVRELFAIELTLVDLFTMTVTIENVADLIERAQSARV